MFVKILRNSRKKFLLYSILDFQSPSKSPKRKQRLYEQFLKLQIKKREIKYKNYKNLIETKLIIKWK